MLREKRAKAGLVALASSKAREVAGRVSNGAGTNAPRMRARWAGGGRARCDHLRRVA